MTSNFDRNSCFWTWCNSTAFARFISLPDTFHALENKKINWIDSISLRVSPNCADEESNAAHYHYFGIELQKKHSLFILQKFKAKNYENYNQNFAFINQTLINIEHTYRNGEILYQHLKHSMFIAAVEVVHHFWLFLFFCLCVKLWSSHGLEWFAFGSDAFQWSRTMN